jgi:hypothetical protein
MIEYGHATEQGSGQLGGGSAGGGGDMGGAAVRWINESIDTVAALPPETLLLLAIVVLAGLFVLKRAF